MNFRNSSILKALMKGVNDLLTNEKHEHAVMF